MTLSNTSCGRITHWLGSAKQQYRESSAFCVLFTLSVPERRLCPEFSFVTVTAFGWLWR